MGDDEIHHSGMGFFPQKKDGFDVDSGMGFFPQKKDGFDTVQCSPISFRNRNPVQVSYPILPDFDLILSIGEVDRMEDKGKKVEDKEEEQEDAMEFILFQVSEWYVYLDVTLGRRVVLAFLILGVVFGDVGTSPLYTFSVMFSKAPPSGDEDVLGALSLVLYTVILIPLIKYVLIVLLANDDGEGGTFALYSLIYRHAQVSLLPNQLPSDAHISSFRFLVPSPELERSLRIKERLEPSPTLKKLLLMLVLAGTSMVIADGIVTPAMSVTSAVGGLKVGIPGIKQDHVVGISVACLVVLFSLQRFGTSKMGLVVGPALRLLLSFVSCLKAACMELFVLVSFKKFF